MPGGFHEGYGGYGHEWGGPSPFWAVVGTALFWMLPWIIVFGVIAWSALRLATTRTAEPASHPLPPSSMEVLREHYVMGHIDLVTFSDAVALLLASESRGYGIAPLYV